MKGCLYTLIILTILLGVPNPSTSAGLTLRYQFKPGQLWECTRMSHMAFTVMGQQQTKKDRDTIVYTVSKGSKAHWVHLSARFERPAGNSEPNPVAMAKYDLTFTADVHVSGDTRNIAVSGMEKRLQDPSLDAGTKMALQQTYDILADTMPAAVFWFPELPEEALQPGDEFEDKRTHGLKNPHMQSTTQSRKTFVLEEVSQGLAYFSTKERQATKMSTMGSKTDHSSAGKGETIFDVKAGMWIELTTKHKMRFSGAMMGGSEDQAMIVIEKMIMQPR
jgi:hypothetical protein